MLGLWGLCHRKCDRAMDHRGGTGPCGLVHGKRPREEDTKAGWGSGSFPQARLLPDPKGCCRDGLTVPVVGVRSCCPIVKPEPKCLCWSKNQSNLSGSF